MIKAQAAVVGLCKDRVCWVEDEVGEEDGIAAFVNQEAACRLSVRGELANRGRGARGGTYTSCGSAQGD